ncbi:MAG TPA: TIGR03435 family protein [Vicinamibacterales bacterium]|nr:TIGR03435 family protein [Vicinamibacterales bacterium]
MINRTSRAAALIVVGLAWESTLVLRAQAPAVPAFETASIRRNPSGSGLHVQMVRGERFISPNATVRELIRAAYLVEDVQIAGGPGWADLDRFMIEAKTGPGVTADTARFMLRTLLTDRFKLAIHIEQRYLPGFMLISSGRAETRDLRPSGAQCAPIRAPRDLSLPPPPPPPPPGDTTVPLTAGTMLSKCGALLAPGYLSARMVTMEQFAIYFSRILRRPIVDRTNLKGLFDIDLMYQMEFQGPVPLPLSPDAPSLFTALQEQLGLKLESQRVPTDVIVIDRVERPSEN